MASVGATHFGGRLWYQTLHSTVNAVFSDQPSGKR